MARTINGNLTGRAARNDGLEELALKPNKQDLRIGRKKKILREHMGEDAFWEFYSHTSMTSSILESQLDKKLEELGVKNVNSD